MKMRGGSSWDVPGTLRHAEEDAPRSEIWRMFMSNKTKPWLKKLRRVPVFLGAALLVIFAAPHPAGIVIGLPLIIIGECIRIWAAGHLQKNENLTVSGPYAHVKNPLYVGTILITAGFCIMADNIYLLSLAMFAFCFHYIPYKKRVEGDRLKKIFGQRYEEYDLKVPEYIPQWTSYPGEGVSWQFKCFIENSEEGILLIVLAGIVLILSRPYWNALLG
jgi:protein-S-isoprenylcysteine O-methyltransferase Ste14